MRRLLPPRGGTEHLVERIVHLVAATSESPVTRACLAERWGITPRAVSNVIARARDLFGVHVVHVPGGYGLRSAGVLSAAACRRRRP